MGADCKSVAKATEVRILYPPRMPPDQHERSGGSSSLGPSDLRPSTFASVNLGHCSDAFRSDGTAGDRCRGSVRARSGGLQVRVFAGIDAVPGEDRYLTETVRGTDRAARREAEKVLARLQAEIDGQRTARTGVSLGYVLDEWLRPVELEDGTRETDVGYIERTVRPALGAVSIAELTARTFQTFYAELRRCRTLCTGRPTPERRAASPTPTRRASLAGRRCGHGRTRACCVHVLGVDGHRGPEVVPGGPDGGPSAGGPDPGRFLGGDGAAAEVRPATGHGRGGR